MTLPDEMNVRTVIETLCSVLSLTYNMFADSIYEGKKCFDLIINVDQTIRQKFILPILDIFCRSAEAIVSEDFSKTKEIIFDEDKHL